MERGLLNFSSLGSRFMVPGYTYLGGHLESSAKHDSCWLVQLASDLIRADAPFWPQESYLVDLKYGVFCRIPQCSKKAVDTSYRLSDPWSKQISLAHSIH